MTSATVALLGTCDTKLQELLFLRERILEAGPVKVIFIDVGRKNVVNEAIDISQNELVTKCGTGKRDLSSLPRGEVIRFMSACATNSVTKLHKTNSIDGIIAVGGSGGTSLTAAVMRDALPIGFPKLIVSTVASGDTGPIVGESDITLMYSVVDVAGLNQVLHDVLANAGAAIAGAALSYASRRNDPRVKSSLEKEKKRVGITMFGVTTPGVDAIRDYLQSNYDIETYVFHATGHGGKAMERLVREGRIDAVLDLTTTEICDLVTGGVMSAGPERLEAAAEAGIPNIISVGAIDMSNFGPRASVPERYKGRRLFEHNPVTTLMRTSPDEARKIGKYICDKLKKHALKKDMVEVWLPRGGVSIISKLGEAFADEEADQALFDTMREELSGSGIDLIEDERDVNNLGFARDIAKALVNKMGLGPIKE